MKAIRQEVTKLLFNSFNSNEHKVKISAMQCLIELVKIYYEYLKDLFALIWEITSSYITGDDKELAILAIEVWNTIANEDKERDNSDVF